MKLYKLGLLSVALASALTGMSAQAATAIGSINQDIIFGGVISENSPKWTWELSRTYTRIDLKNTDGVVENNTKTWQLFTGREGSPLLKGTMSSTVPGLALVGLSPEVKYLYNGGEVTPTYGTQNETLLSIKATGNKSTTPVTGDLKLTITPVLYLGQANNTAVLDAKLLAGSSVIAPSTNAKQANANALINVNEASDVLKTTHYNVDDSLSNAWPADTLADGKVLSVPTVGGYASSITNGQLSFPSTSSIQQWESTITIQVAYK